MIVELINNEKFEREAKILNMKNRIAKRIEQLTKYRNDMTDSEKLNNWFLIGNEIRKLNKILNSLE